MTATDDVEASSSTVFTLLEQLDQAKRALQEEYPGWQIWYVFHHDGLATWHARPTPWLKAPNPDDLRKLINQASQPTG